MNWSSGYQIRTAGVVDLWGAGRETFLQGQCTNDILRAAPGAAIPAATLTPKGKLLFVYRAARFPDHLRVLIRSESAPALLAHFRKYAVFDAVTFEDRSAEYVRVDFLGENFPDAARQSEHAVQAAEFHAVSVEVWPREGECGAIWLAPSGRRKAIEDHLAHDFHHISDDEREIRRIESGRPEWGVDMDGSNLPDEVGLEESISRTKGCYVGQETVARVKTYGHVNKRFVGFSFSRERVPPAGTILVRPDAPEKEAGRVTSAVQSPEFGAIGLGYARREIAAGETLLRIDDPGTTAVVGPAKRA